MKYLLLVAVFLFAVPAQARVYTHKEALEGCTVLVTNLAEQIINAVEQGATRDKITFKGRANNVLEDMNKFTDSLYAEPYDEATAIKWFNKAIRDCTTHMEQVSI